MAHIPRIYTEFKLSAKTPIELPEGQAKYLTRVMRLGENAVVRVFNGQDGEWECSLQTVGKRVQLIPNRPIHPQYDPPDLTLLFAPLKKTRTDFVVEKASELGVRTLQPVLTEFTQTSRVRTDKLQALAIEAAEQTERLDVPTVKAAVSLTAALQAWNPKSSLIYCDEAGDAAPLFEIEPTKRSSIAGVLVGPEGGFSQRERKLLRSFDFVIPITLGPRILRAETAVVAAITLWQSVLGDWGERPYLPDN